MQQNARRQEAVLSIFSSGKSFHQLTVELLLILTSGPRRPAQHHLRLDQPVPGRWTMVQDCNEICATMFEATRRFFDLPRQEYNTQFIHEAVFKLFGPEQLRR